MLELKQSVVRKVIDRFKATDVRWRQQTKAA